MLLNSNAESDFKGIIIDKEIIDSTTFRLEKKISTVVTEKLYYRQIH